MEMPRPIRFAIRSMYLGAVCYFLANVLPLAQIKGARSDVQFMLVLLTAGLCAVYSLLVSRVSERSKFALILLLVVGVLSALNLASNASGLPEAFKTDPLVAGLGLAANVLLIVALVLLCLPASREWFRRADPAPS